MEDYKEKYEQALERAKGLYNSVFVNNDVLEQIFPELLKENENYDEKIRKALINRFNESGELDGIPYDDIRIWLEKQCDQNPADKVEPKFKVGDWINKDGAIWRIEGVSGKEYILGGRPDVIMQEPIHIIESEFHLWTIQDARDGDVLCYRNDIFLVKSYVLFNKVVSHCTYSKRFIPHNIYSFTREDFNKIYPATKEQRDLLFQKMKEAGYEWDDEKKELRQKSAKWSEKDEKISKAIYQSIDYPCLESFGVSEDEVYDWFKSLKTYYHWKPSDEQMKALKQWLNEHRYDGNSRYIYAIINSLYEQLKSL